MDYLDAHLADAASDVKYSISIKAAVSIGLKTLNHYYDKTDHSEVFRIAMGTSIHSSASIKFIYITAVLHPRHKLQYFKNANWPQDWINTAKDIVREEFDRSYASSEVEEVPTTQVSLSLFHLQLC
jgi:hypothetical protein